MAFLNEHVIRVRFSYNGPLKEDKGKGHRKVKWVPAPVDWKEVLSPWLSRREAEGATPECLVFPRVRLRDLNAAATKGVAPVVTKRFMIFHFRAVADELGLEMTWYQATRHSFVSRCLRAGASLDEVSAAVGHSSTLVTRRFYDHYIRKSFSPILRSGIGSTEPGGEDHPATKANPSADPNTGDLPS